MDSPNRHRISTKFIMVKIVIYIGFASILFNVIKNINHNTITREDTLGLIFGSLLSGAILYYLNTRKIIEYDDVKLILYAIDSKRQLETEIPVERIDKILLSGLVLETLKILI